MLYRFLDSVWFLPVMFSLFLVAIELGHRFSLSRPRKEAAQSRAMASAIIMFLALMLTFTIREQSTSYRKTLEYQGDLVDAVSDTWRLIEMLDPPDQSLMMEPLKRYLRAKVSTSIMPQDVASTLFRDIWSGLGSLRERLGEKAASDLTTSVSKVIRAHFRTENNIGQRLPVSIGIMDLAGIFLVSFLVGYVTGTRTARAWTVYLVFLGMVILTLDSIQTLARLRKGVGSENSKRLEAVYLAIEGQKKTEEGR